MARRAAVYLLKMIERKPENRSLAGAACSCARRTR